MASERFLLVQLADIGDLVLTTPALSALREAHPNARIDLFASDIALPLLPAGLVDATIPFQRHGNSSSHAFFSPDNLRQLIRIWRTRYTAVLFFHHFTMRAGLLKFRLIAAASGAHRIIGLKNRHSGFLTEFLRDDGFGTRHQAQYWLDLVALLGASNSPRPAQVKRETFPTTEQWASSAGKRPRVVIHAGSGGYSRARRWLPEHFAEVARQLKDDYNAKIVLVGGREDDGHLVEQMLDFELLNLVGETTLPQLAEVIHGADLFIGSDSGVMHIAAATGTPVISIFGPSNADAWGPWPIGGQSSILRSQVECSPCSYIGHSIGAREGCAARSCMKLVCSEQVLEAARRIIDQSDNAAAEMMGASQTGPAQPPKERMKILGVPVDGISYEAWMKQIGDWVTLDNGAQHVCTVNPEFVMIAQTDSIFFNILNRAALCVPDGVGLLWASRHLGTPLPERVTGSDAVPLIAKYAAEHGWKIFLLGAGEGVAASAAEILQRRYPGLVVAGSYSGSPAEAQEDEIVAMVNASGADILFVAYGAPKQDKWIARNLPRLQVSMAMGVGGSLDFIAGVIPRAPRWMRDRGLEWLYRLMRQPWRLRRMLRLPRFVIAVLRQSRGKATDASPPIR